MENSNSKELNFFQKNLDRIATALREGYRNAMEKSLNEQALLRPEAFLNPLAKSLKNNSSNSIEKHSAKLFERAVNEIQRRDEHLITVINQKDIKLALVFSAISENSEIRASADRIIMAVQELKSNPEFHRNISNKARDEFGWKSVALNTVPENLIKNKNLEKRVEAELKGGSLSLEFDSRVSSQALETMRNMSKMAAKVVLQVLKENNVVQGLESISKKVSDAGKRNGMDGLEDLNTFIQSAHQVENIRSKGL